MKAFGLLMAVAALIAACVGASKLSPTKLESLQEDVVASQQKLANFTSNSEKLMSTLGHPQSFGATEARDKLKDSEDELTSRRQGRQSEATIAFGVAGFLVLLSVISFASGSLGAKISIPQTAATPSSNPPPLPQQRYFIFSESSVQGPYEKSVLIAMRGIGAIENSTMCCAEGSETWTELTTVLDS